MLLLFAFYLPSLISLYKNEEQTHHHNSQHLPVEYVLILQGTTTVTAKK